MVGCFAVALYVSYLRRSFTAGYCVRSFAVVELGGFEVVEDIARGSVRHRFRRLGLRDEFRAAPPVVAPVTRKPSSSCVK